MYKRKVMRTIAVASAIAMMLTSVPVLAMETEPIEEADGILESGIIDTEIPAITDVWFGKNKTCKSIKVSHSDMFEFAAVGTDNLSGVKNVRATFTLKKTGGFDDTKAIILDANENNYNENDSYKYYPANEVHANYNIISADTVKGTYQLTSLFVYDEAGNNINYKLNNPDTSRELPENLKNVTIEVTDDKVEAPKEGEITEVSVTPATATGKTVVTVKAGYKAIKGDTPDSMNVEFIIPESDEYLYFSLQKDSDGKYSGEKEISEYQKSGDYVLEYVEYYSGSGWNSYYGKGSTYYNDTKKKKVPEAYAGLTLKIKDTKTDTTPPVLKDITFNNYTVSVPGAFTYKLDATDNMSGINYHRVSLKSVEGYYSIYGEEVYDTLNGSITVFDQYKKTADYKIDVIYIEDKAGNVAIYAADPSQYSDAVQLPDKYRDLEFHVINDDESEGQAIDVTTSTTLDSLVSDIKSAADNSQIHVDITQHPILPKEALAAIKGTGKTLLLNSNDSIQYELYGKNVKDASKDWNLDADVYGTDDDRLKPCFGDKFNGAIYFKFMERAAFPGTAKVRIIPKGYDREYLKGKTDGIYVYSCDVKDDSKARTTTYTLNPIAGPISLSADKNVEFEMSSSEASGHYYITNCKASKLSCTEKWADPRETDPTKRFSDVPAGKWYSKPDGPIAYVISNGIMNGTGDGSTFAPEDPCTREMFVQILYNVEGAPGAGPSNPFSDVKSGKWYYNAVTWAFANSVTSGKSATLFGVGENVTREQLAQFLLNYATKRGFNTKDRADLSKFPDAGSISGWAKNAISWANANGIINGKIVKGVNYLDPKGNATRAETAQMLMGFQKKFGK